MKICIPGKNNSSVMTGARMKGRGIGAVLLDGGTGGQSSYSSVDDYMATTNARYPKSTGAGLSGLDQIRGKMENLMIKPKVQKSKNIKFSL
jgi:hypothetical protein